jgi:hypothetical protein
MGHEILLIKRFVVKDRQERYLNLMSTANGRNKFKTYLAHFKDLDGKFCQPVHLLPSSSELVDLLRSAGSPDLCYVISENPRYDMKTLPLADAGQHLYNSGIGFFLSCIPGKLAYYEGEEPHQRFLLKA